MKNIVASWLIATLLVSTVTFAQEAPVFGETLVIRVTMVRLEGIQGERGTLARQLARFLRRREVICAPSDTPSVQRCRIGNYNLSAIILAAGGGRATPDASEELQAAEDQARSARLGVWRRGR